MRLLILAAALFVPACAMNDVIQGSAAERHVAPILNEADARDAHSFARPEVARVTHVALDLDADFEARRMAGTATLDIAAAPNAEEIILDTNGLDIQGITGPGGARLSFVLGAGDEMHGRPLIVRIGAARRITIRYRSGEDAPALQWLNPDQTAGKRHPYLLSQGEAIHNRSWIPTQDSPGIRQTWEARITAPAPLTVVMSGERLTPDGEPAGPGRRAYRFRMTHPVAPYLIAIAAGDIVFRALGPRTGVWTEPATLDAAARELADTERMVTAAEALYGPYRWGRYDMIVLPPSFPYGGMENPTLTFLTPTLIAGDRSLVGTGRARAGAQLVGQSRHQCDLDRFLAQRGLHLLFREPDHGGDLRPRSRRPGGIALLGRHAGGPARAGSRRAGDGAPLRPDRPGRQQ